MPGLCGTWSQQQGNQQQLPSRPEGTRRGSYSVSQLCLTLCNPMDCSMPGFLSITNSWSLLKLTSIPSVMPYNNLILYNLLLFLPSIFPTIMVFSNESAVRIQVTKVLELQLQHQSSNEYSGLISFRIDWFDLLAAQGPLKSLL